MNKFLIYASDQQDIKILFQQVRGSLCAAGQWESLNTKFWSLLTTPKNDILKCPLGGNPAPIEDLALGATL